MRLDKMTGYGLSMVFMVSASSLALAGGPSTQDPPIASAARGGVKPAGAGVAAAALASAAAVPGGTQVGYYDMTFEVGLDYLIAPIVAGGGSPVLVDDPSAAQLANLNVLFVTNPSNGGFGFEYTNRLPEIAAAVQSGMILVVHDRTVGGASSVLPAAGSFEIVRDFTEQSDINIRNGTTQVTAGLDDLSLDGGSSSSHGFALDSTLPARAKLILSATTPSHVVTFCYPVGRGAVIYSSIPLDFYLQGQGPQPLQSNLANIYSPNVVRYALASACAARGPRPTPN